MNQKLKKFEKTLCDRVDAMMNDKKYASDYSEKRRLCAEIRATLQILEDLYDIMAEDEDYDDDDYDSPQRGPKE